MARESKIEWTDATWNPWYGCRKVSPGCAYCYAERDMSRYGRDFDTVTRAKDATFYAPLKWKEPRLIFTCSWSDFFIEEADKWRHDALEIMAQTPRHVYLVLTKRPERIGTKVVGLEYLPNVCLMTTVENQRQADERIPKLLEIPARWHAVSVEPLLGPVDLRQGWLDWFWGAAVDESTLDWVIVGGESGGPQERRLVEPYGAGWWRPLPHAYRWVNTLRYQCVDAGVPFLFKQWGGPKPTSGGRLLDGRTWDEKPDFFGVAQNLHTGEARL